MQCWNILYPFWIWSVCSIITEKMYIKLYYMIATLFPLLVPINYALYILKLLSTGWHRFSSYILLVLINIRCYNKVSWHNLFLTSINSSALTFIYPVFPFFLSFHFFNLSASFLSFFFLFSFFFPWRTGHWIQVLYSELDPLLFIKIFYFETGSH